MKKRWKSKRSITTQITSLLGHRTGENITHEESLLQTFGGWKFK